MSDLEKPYEPSLVEEEWYAFWMKEGLFTANPKNRKPSFSIVLPPPNVTGVLHMGHALVNTLQDIQIRWMKMRGYETAWIPGTDHAGISTQSVVEKSLFAKTGKRRQDFDREEFLRHVWAWKEDHSEKILSQLKKLGCALDWTRLRFTMDEQSTKAVKFMFKKMFDEGLIHRGDYLVNWDPVLQTAIADDEVEHEEQNSYLWHIRYPIEGSKEYLVLATTRPETILGDTAVAVSPGDPRYAKLVGKQVRLPLTERLVPIIEDRYVDPKFGTGVVKITPAHDFNDYEVGFRHDLPLINIMNRDATLNENAGPFEGLSREEARKEIVKELQRLGLIEKIESHTNRVGVSYKSKAIIEPYLSKQWFIKMGPFKEKLLSAVRDEKTVIIPQGWDKTYFHWIENLRDWCISRQLWWGHRIPIWYNVHNEDQIICHIEDGLPQEVIDDPEGWRQDDDVLDTWFSSALWPLTTLGWPEKTEDLQKFYPNSTLITGHDILFFWVARMMVMGEYATGELPFPKTFVHGLIYGKSYWREAKNGGISYVDANERLKYELGEAIPSDVHHKWEKMSKSKGNVIDPIEIIDQYGADAMRFALTSSVTHARQIDLDRRRFEEFKNFANKVWNATRFIVSNLGANEKADMPALVTNDLQMGLNRALFTTDDAWILSRLNRVIDQVNDHLGNYVFNEAAKTLYAFFWDEFCAYYVELSKPYLFGKVGNAELRKNKQKVLLTVFFASIRLMHPIAPFITEELFSILKGLFPTVQKRGSVDPYMDDLIAGLSMKSIMLSPFPEKLCQDDISEEAEGNFAFINETIYAIRNIRAEMQIPPGMATDIHIVGKSSKELLLIESNQTMITSLIRAQMIAFHETEPKVQSCSTAVLKGLKILIPLPKELQEKEKSRLEKELEKQRGQISSLEAKLSNPSFTERAPQELVENTKKALKEAQTKEIEITSKLKSL